MIVVDASALVVALADDGAAGASTRLRLLEAADLHAPHLVDVEVTAALRRLVVVQRSMTSARGTAAIEDLADLPITRYPHPDLLGRAWELRHTIRPYDGVDVALAEALGVALLTDDARLAAASGPHCPIETVAHPA